MCGLSYKEEKSAWTFHAMPRNCDGVTIAHSKSFRWIGVFLWEFDRDLTGSTKKCP